MISSLCREKHKIAAAFGRAAKNYDSVASYQQATGEQLLKQLTSELALMPHSAPLRVLDAGCGTGYFSQKLTAQGYQVIALDISVGMLDVAEGKCAADHYICADIETIPLADQSVDVVFSNLALQWCQDITQALSELYRVTKRGGIVVFTTLGEHSLSELSSAWKALDDAPHVNVFLGVQQMRNSCQRWRNQLTIQKDTLYFSGITELLHSLKGIGATHLTAGRKTGLMTRQRLKQLAAVYPITEQGLPLTYYTVFGVLYRD
ncbi:TPA: malonyl-ACP O-methyltransferase BioC [Providencia rettgeri]|uniref:malonyl-ACP O-methyltransferase BioC n=1 Tax=Providencia TaxID=586 RepID=UPI0005B33A03|nr:MULTISPECIES: malonyl-ACP O-methyltransferase BioC [Providencia]EJD6399734.1 malonyl-ACP O-methyltransferase BioC [Providencia rettgeri]ELR5146958.1 malonyl-ACP O-methyltransferase BioC [Providencia rettgeri]ELR5240582.1 malonyl-ACP O-methyltransferase BioC [Providencia rettgeri]ELR5257998.1 malonyl-ACP O-methyltransferase BioC [Providencia rettgeri]MBQ0688037.1 malonyl-ACP O-methyltransferase BioC [Providencia rettgeri]